MPIVIAHVIYKLDVGGLENGLVNLINRMPADRYRHVIICMTDYTDFSSRIRQQVELHAMHKKPGKDPGLYLRLWKLFRKIKPDIVHTRNLATLEAQLPALLAGVRCRVHGEHGRDVHDLDGVRRKYQILRKLFRPIVDHFIPLSRELHDYLSADVGVDNKQITPICNGVDIDRFHPAEFTGIDDMPASFRGADVVVVGTVGRMEVVKDQLTLAHAFIDLVSRDPRMRAHVRLLMVGDGSCFQQVQDLLEKSGCSDIVWLPGSRSDVPEMLRIMDIFVLPSLAEGISNTILEAMATGLPVIATDVGGNSELVLEGETGYLVPRSDTRAMSSRLRNYVDHPAMIEQHGVNARNRIVAEFSIGQMVDKYMRVYDELIVNKCPEVMVGSV